MLRAMVEETKAVAELQTRQHGNLDSGERHCGCGSSAAATVLRRGCHRNPQGGVGEDGEAPDEGEWRRRSWHRLWRRCPRTTGLAAQEGAPLDEELGHEGEASA